MPDIHQDHADLLAAQQPFLDQWLKDLEAQHEYEEFLEEVFGKEVTHG